MALKDTSLFLTDAWGFFRQWVRQPSRVAAPMPSSKYLAQAMVRQANIPDDTYVIELGAGTGIVTKALLQSGVPANKLLVIEKDKYFYDLLCKRYPDVKIVCADACDLVEICKKNQIPSVSAIISSLPMLLIPEHIQLNILQQSFSLLQKDRPFLQYCYSRHSPIAQKHLNVLRVKQTPRETIWRNFPPARIWSFHAEAA